MKKTYYFTVLFLFMLLGKVVNADIVTVSSEIDRKFPWYLYIVLGVFWVILISISMVLLAKIKYRKKNNPLDNN